MGLCSGRLILTATPSRAEAEPGDTRVWRPEWEKGERPAPLGCSAAPARGPLGDGGAFRDGGTHHYPSALDLPLLSQPRG